MPGLVPGIHAFLALGSQDVDGRDKPGHDVDGVLHGGYDAICGVIWWTSPVLRSMRIRVIWSRLVPVTRTNLA